MATVQVVLNTDNLLQYLSNVEGIGEHLTNSPKNWKAVKIRGDKISSVYHVHAAEGADEEHVCIKQVSPAAMVLPRFPSAPYKSRIACEAEYLREASLICKNRVPKVLVWNETLANDGVIVMECLPDTQALRHLMNASAGNVEKMRAFAGEQIGHYLAHMAFFTSELALASSKKKIRMGWYAARNHKLSAHQEEVVYTWPFQENSSFAHSRLSPELDLIAKAIREDVELRVAAGEVKRRVLSSTEMLAHGLSVSHVAFSAR